MAQVTLKGKPIHTCGELPEVGTKAMNFTLTKIDLSDTTLADYSGKRIVLNIFPSIDTEVCAASVRYFNRDVAKRADTVVLCVSLDLPFAHKRFCGADGLTDVISVSEMRSRAFGEFYGVRIVDGPLAGLFARAVIIIDPQGMISYTQLVPEIVQEPDYESVLQFLG
ncbi:MAG: thiol peroxidase [Magnetococcus sp. DMHC-6]